MDKTLSKIKFLKDIREITFVDFEAKLNDEQQKQRARENSSQLKAFSFFYESNGRWIWGAVIVPKEFDPTKNYPCVVTNRGGTRNYAAINYGSLFVGYFAWPALAGYISITTNLDPEEHMGDTQDTADVLRLYDILKEIPQADLDNIGMFGWSRGGQALYQCLRLKTPWIKNGISIAGAADHFDSIKWRNGWKEHCEAIFGGGEAELKERSALYWTEEINPVPLLLMHGTADERVSYKDSVRLHEKLKHSKLILYENDDHDLTNHKEQAQEQCTEWWKTHFK